MLILVGLFPYGVTAYIHGGELDRPLSIYRDDHSVERSAMRIQLIANWKGDFVTGAFDDGTAADCMASAQPSCIDIQWPGERVWHGWENKDPELVQNGPRHWMGSLVYGSADASGLLYRRNRYYDPVAGQFTQEDPIGIAGGLNLYGFAGGDPVNFSDPFGLTACCNLAKLAVGVGNTIRSAQIFISGSAKLVAGGPLAGVGAAQVGVFAPGTFRRGLLQIRESVQEDFFDASPRNLLGFAPLGQMFDDPDEPTPIDFLSDLADLFEEDKDAALAQFVMDYLVRSTSPASDDDTNRRRGGGSR